MSCCPKPCCPKPSCPPVKACFSNQGRNTLLNDVLGPYSDEVIMTALDRILYCFGATKIFHQFKSDDQQAINCPPQASCSAPCTPRYKPSCSSMNSRMSNTSFSKYCSASSRNTCRPATVCWPTPAPTPPKPSSIKSKCSTVRPTRPRTPHVDFANPVIDDRQKTAGLSLAERIKFSLSSASAAYNRLKTKLATNLKGCGQKWLWTRLIRTEDGCHVYEVYKNSNVECAPQTMKGAKEAVILFVVTPQGHVMPFETVSSY